MIKLKRFLLVLLSAILMSGVVNSVSASVITLDETADLGVWQVFNFDDIGSSGSDTYEFTLTGPLSFFVTDAFAPGDRFEIFDGGSSLGLTSDVDDIGANIGNDYQAAYNSSEFSSGFWLLGAGFHNISISVVTSPFGGGDAAVRLGTAPVPEPATMLLFGLGLLGLAGVSRKKP